MADLGSTTVSETAASNNAASPDGMAENNAPSSVNNTYREGLAAQKRWWNRLNGVKTTGGTANAQTCTYDVAEASYYVGARTMVKVGGGLTNTGPAAINISGLGAVTILTAGGSALIGGELQGTTFAELIYDGTNQRLLSQYHVRGSYTATISVGSGTVAQNVSTGRYERVGNLVSFWATIGATGATSASGTLLVSLPPYTAENSTTSDHAVTLSGSPGSSQFMLSGAGLYFSAHIAPGATQVTIIAHTQAGGGLTSGGSSIINTTSLLTMSGRYRTTS